MDSLKPEYSRREIKTHQDKNMEYIERLSERVRQKKESESLSSCRAIPTFNNYINGANGAKSGCICANDEEKHEQVPVYKDIALQQARPCKYQDTDEYHNNSVCLESINAIKSETIQPNGSLHNQNTQDMSMDRINLHYDRSYHKNDDDDDLSELDEFMKNSDPEGRLAMGPEENAGAVQGDNKQESSEELKMVKLENCGRRLEPEYIPESLFNLIDEIDECYDQSPSVNQHPTNFIITDEVIEGSPEQNRATDFEPYEGDDPAREETTISQQGNAKHAEIRSVDGSDQGNTDYSSPTMICPNFTKIQSHDSTQKQTQLNFYEEGEVIEQKSPKSHDTLSEDNKSKQVHETKLELYEEGDIIENSSGSRQLANTPPAFDISMRNKMTITKEELYQLTHSGYGDACLIDCGREKQESTTVKNTEEIAFNARDIISQEMEQIRERHAEDEPESKPPRSKKLVKRKKVSTSPPIEVVENEPKGEVIRRLKKISAPNGEKSKQDRANNLMFSLKESGIDVDDLALRMNHLNQKQRMIILGVLKSIEKGEVENISDVKSFIDAEQPEHVLNCIEVNKSLPKPRRAKRILNNQVLSNSELGGSHGKAPKDLKRK